MINFGALNRLADLSPPEILRGLVHGTLSAAPLGLIRQPLPDHGALQTVADIENFLWKLVCPPGDPKFIDYLRRWFAKEGEARAAADPNAAQSGSDAAFAVPPKFPNLAELAADLHKIRQSDAGFAEALIDGRLEDAAGCCGSAPDAGKVQTLGKMMLVHSLFELQAIGDELHQSIWRPNSLLVTKSTKPHTGDTVSSLFLNGLNLVDDVRTAFYSGKQFTPSDRGSAVSRIGRFGRSSGLMDSNIFRKFVAFFPQDAQKKGLPAHDKRMRLLSLAVRRADKFLQPIEARMRTAAEQRVLVPEWARPVGSASADRAMYSRMGSMGYTTTTYGVPAVTIMAYAVLQFVELATNSRKVVQQFLSEVSSNPTDATAPTSKGADDLLAESLLHLYRLVVLRDPRSNTEASGHHCDGEIKATDCECKFIAPVNKPRTKYDFVLGAGRTIGDKLDLRSFCSASTSAVRGEGGRKALQHAANLLTDRSQLVGWDGAAFARKFDLTSYARAYPLLKAEN